MEKFREATLSEKELEGLEGRCLSFVINLNDTFREYAATNHTEEGIQVLIDDSRSIELNLIKTDLEVVEFSVVEHHDSLNDSSCNFSYFIGFVTFHKDANERFLDTFKGFETVVLNENG